MVGATLASVKSSALDTPDGELTVKVLVPGVAPAWIVTLTVRLVSEPPDWIVPSTPDPLKVTAVAAVNAVPEIIARNVVPTAPAGGVIPVITGGVLEYTVSGRDAVTPPPGTGFATVIENAPTATRSAEGTWTWSSVALT